MELKDNFKFTCGGSDLVYTAVRDGDLYKVSWNRWGEDDWLTYSVEQLKKNIGRYKWQIINELPAEFHYKHKSFRPEQFNRAVRQECGNYTLHWGDGRVDVDFPAKNVQQYVDKGSWIIVPAPALLKEFYFKRPETDHLFLAQTTRKGDQYRVDWITQGGYPETQGYYSVDAVQRFVDTGEWVQCEAPKEPKPLMFVEVQAYARETGARVIVMPSGQIYVAAKLCRDDRMYKNEYEFAVAVRA